MRVVGELNDWEGHSPEQIQAMRDGLAALEERGENTIIDYGESGAGAASHQLSTRVPTSVIQRPGSPMVSSAK